MQQRKTERWRLRYSAAVTVALLTVWLLMFRGQSRAAALYTVQRSFSQEADVPEEEAPIPAEQVDKYIAVYTAMQRDHSLTVDEATARNGLTVRAFRDLESRIERNPVAHERVLEALRKAAKQNSTPHVPAPGTR